MLKSRRYVSSFVSKNIFELRAQVRKQAEAIQSELASECVQHCQTGGHGIKDKPESKDIKSERKGGVQDTDICGMQVNVPQ
jgi:transcriptional regulator of met regulon